MAESWDFGHPYRPDADKKRAQGDLRDTKAALCLDCKREWIAPVIGRCPSCCSENTAEQGAFLINLPRV